MQQPAQGVAQLVLHQPGATKAQRGGEPVPPVALAMHRLVSRGGRRDGHRKCALGFGLRQGAIGPRQGKRRAARQRQLGAANRQLGLAVDRGQGRAQRFEQRTGTFLGHAGGRQVKREVGAIQAAGQRTLHMLRIGLQHLSQRRQQPVSGLAADAPVHRIQVAQPHQHQAGAAVVFGAQCMLHLGHEMAAQRQPGQGIGMGLLAQGLQRGCLVLEHRLQPPHQRIHAARQAAQLRHPRFVGDDEVLFLQRLRLRHRGVQRPAPAAHRQRRQRRRPQPQQCQPAGHTQAAGPQRVQRPVGLAGQLHGAHGTPAIGHRRHAGRCRHWQQPCEPARRGAGTFGQFALEDQAAVRAQQPQPAVVAGVELRCGHQLHACRIALLLRQRQCQHHGAVVVAHLQLRLQRLARHQRVRGHAADQRQQKHAQQHQPDLADQAHHVPRSSLMESLQRAPWPSPRASASAARPGCRR